MVAEGERRVFLLLGAGHSLSDTGKLESQAGWGKAQTCWHVGGGKGKKAES